MIEESTDSPLVDEIQALLEKARTRNCHEVVIEALEQAVLHQRISEDIEDIEKGIDGSKREKENL